MFKKLPYFFRHDLFFHNISKKLRGQGGSSGIFFLKLWEPYAFKSKKTKFPRKCDESLHMYCIDLYVQDFNMQLLWLGTIFFHSEKSS